MRQEVFRIGKGMKIEDLPERLTPFQFQLLLFKLKSEKEERDERALLLRVERKRESEKKQGRAKLRVA